VSMRQCSKRIATAGKSRAPECAPSTTIERGLHGLPVREAPVQARKSSCPPMESTGAAARRAQFESPT